MNTPNNISNTPPVTPLRENFQWRLKPKEWESIAPFFHSLAMSPSEFLRALFSTVQRDYDHAEWADCVAGRRPWPAKVLPVTKKKIRPAFIFAAVIATAMAMVGIVTITGAYSSAYSAEARAVVATAKELEAVHTLLKHMKELPDNRLLRDQEIKRIESKIQMWLSKPKS